jgi:hypothetical protein
MSEVVSLETRVKIDALVREIAKRDYPPVFVVEEYSAEANFMWSLEGLKWTDQQWIELAMQQGIPVLGGMDVVHNLRGEMDPGDEFALRDQVLKVFAAKCGMVLLYDLDHDYRLKLKGNLYEQPSTVKMVTVEELSPEEIADTWFIEVLECSTRKWPNVFLIPPTEPVLRFLEEHGEYEGT